MTDYDFQIYLDVSGISEQREFFITARSLPEAVHRSLARISRETPQAEFSGLTYYHPPLDSPWYDTKPRRD